MDCGPVKMIRTFSFISCNGWGDDLMAVVRHITVHLSSSYFLCKHQAHKQIPAFPDESSPNISSQHSLVRLFTDDARVLRAVRVIRSCHSRQWILPHLVCLISFLSQKTEGVCLFFFFFYCFMISWRRPLIGLSGRLFHLITDGWIASLKHEYVHASWVWLGVGGLQGRGRLASASSKGPKMLPGSLASWGRQLKPHWPRNAGGVAFWLGVFNALFHCCAECFPAGLAQESRGGPQLKGHHCTLSLSLFFFFFNFYF